MTTKKHLRAATEDDVPAAPMTITEAAESGSQLDQLIALRRRIAKMLDVDDVQGRDMASLSKRLMEISKEINELMSAESEDVFDKAANTEDEAFNPRAV